MNVVKYLFFLFLFAFIATRINKKRKFVADGVMYAEINELMLRELQDGGYGGIEIRNVPMRTEIIIKASRPQDVLGDKGKRIRELNTLIQKRFGFPDGAVELFAERVNNRGLSAQAQAESLKYKLLGGLAVRRACYGIIRFVMESGAKGVEVVVAGKLRGQRAKAMKFRDGYMVKSGNSSVLYNDYATRHVAMRQGMMGCRVRIMLPTEAGKVLSDVVEISTPK